MGLPQTDVFKWGEILPFANLDMLEGIDGYPQNLLTYDQVMANARLLATSRFKWDSKDVMPKDRLSEFIEMLLYLKGQCALFKDTDGWKVRCCVPSGGLDEYGQPDSFNLTDYNGTHMVTVKNDDERFIWIKNNAACIPTIFWIVKYCNRVAKIERTMDLNIDAQKTPFIIETSPEIHLSIQNIFKEIRQMDEVVYVDQKTGIKDNVQVLKLDAPYLVDKLYTQKQNEFNDLLNFLGINTVKEKTAHILYKEATATDELTDSYLDMFSAPRIKAMEIAKERGLKISLSILSTDNEEVDDNAALNRDNNGKNIPSPVAENKDVNAKRILEKKTKIEGE